jgi:acetoin utilization deacetylase AcuC-like enzyme
MILYASILGQDSHVNWPGHPESPDRLAAVERGLVRLEDMVVPLEFGPAADEDLTRAHSPEYLASLRNLCLAGGGELDPDTAAAAGSFETARLAAGMGLAAVRQLRTGGAEAAFLATRPPGHHATRNRAMGFCLLNNLAVTAARLVADGQRVLVVDWDVHHGNGTQEIFWAEPAVLYVSTHEWPAYPGTGRPSEVGVGDARGTTLNVPLPPGATGDVAREALESMIAPAVEAFGPDWVLVSAGYDAHRRDPLAGLSWSAGDFWDWAAAVAALAPAPGRVIAFLEGGYDLEALTNSTMATVCGLTGTPFRGEAPTAGGPGRDHVRAAARIRARALAEG